MGDKAPLLQQNFQCIMPTISREEQLLLAIEQKGQLGGNRSLAKNKPSVFFIPGRLNGYHKQNLRAIYHNVLVKLVVK